MPDGGGPGYARSQPKPEPSNPRAERALLGALLANNEHYERVADYLLPEHFFEEANQVIYQAIQSRCEKGAPVDTATLESEFAHSGKLKSVGGIRYLHELMCARTEVINAPDHGPTIYDCFLRRQLIKAAREIARKAYSTSHDIDGERQIEIAEQLIAELSPGSGDMKPVSLSEAIQLAIKEGEDNLAGKSTFTSTGFRSIDEKVMGLRPSWLYVVAGRPSMGKSSLARSIALNVACGGSVGTDGEFSSNQDRGQPVLYCSMEEQAPDWGAALAAQMTKVPISTILSGKWDRGQCDRLKAAQKLVRDAKIECVRKPRQSLRQIASAARKFKRRHRSIGLLVVDFLQLMPDYPGTKDKRLGVGENVYGLQALAKELECPVIVLSQLSRAVENREDSRPTMADLKETSQIEEAADVIALLYRAEYYHRLNPPKPNTRDNPNGQSRAKWNQTLADIEGKADVILAKIRRGQTGVVHLGFNAPASRFEELPTT